MTERTLRWEVRHGKGPSFLKTDLASVALELVTWHRVSSNQYDVFSQIPVTATCVALSRRFSGLTRSQPAYPTERLILWMPQAAIKQAAQARTMAAPEEKPP